jgi:hypothetical protein
MLGDLQIIVGLALTVGLATAVLSLRRTHTELNEKEFLKCEDGTSSRWAELG